jgi:ribosomal protein L7/L12
MSQTRIAGQLAVDRGEWNEVLVQRRADGFTPAESIKITRAVLRVRLGEAKEIVHNSAAWADMRDCFEQLHDSAEAAAAQLH